jgi:hypothetical protein
MERELFLKEKTNVQVLVRSDDLTYDGNNIVIPSYYVNSIIEYIENFNTTSLSEADCEDYNDFKEFLQQVQTYKNQSK